jgi:hypothetical protein
MRIDGDIAFSWCLIKLLLLWFHLNSREEAGKATLTWFASNLFILLLNLRVYLWLPVCTSSFLLSEVPRPRRSNFRVVGELRDDPGGEGVGGCNFGTLASASRLIDLHIWEYSWDYTIDINLYKRLSKNITGSLRKETSGCFSSRSRRGIEPSWPTCPQIGESSCPASSGNAAPTTCCFPWFQWAIPRDLSFSRILSYTLWGLWLVQCQAVCFLTP